MALYIFENMSADDAVAFTSADKLIFASATVTPADVVVSNSNALNVTSVTAGGKTLSFPGNELEGAYILFASGDETLILGSNNGENLDDGDADPASRDHDNFYYGFGGNDTLGDDSINSDGNDFMFGGAGNDDIDGDGGNDHLYGYGLTGDPATDGNDTVSGGNGNDYIQGNAGNDMLTGDGDRDRINGGAGDDDINGGSGNDTVNGNKGEDDIVGGSGNDSLRGGGDNDSISGGDGNDIILGDLGDDTLSGGTNNGGGDILTGGGGADQFRFGDTGEASYPTTGAFAYFTDTITDFTIGEDTIDIQHDLSGGMGSGAILTQDEGVEFSTVAAALTYAQQTLDDADGNDNNVVALQVGADTYLFFDDNAVADDLVNSAIKLAGVTAAGLTGDDFILSVG